MDLNFLIYESDSDFKNKFMSKENIKIIKNVVEYRIYNYLKKRIRVNTEDLIVLMSNYYHMRSDNTQLEIDILNKKIIDRLYTDIVNSDIDYHLNLKEMDNPNGEEFVSTPVSTNAARQGRGNAEILFGDIWEV